MKVTEKVNRVNEDEANEEHHDPSLDRTGRSVYSGGGGGGKKKKKKDNKNKPKNKKKRN